MRACVLNCFSHIRSCATPWTTVHQVPLSMGFSRQEYWSGFPCPPLGDLPDTGIEPTSPESEETNLPCRVIPNNLSKYVAGRGTLSRAPKEALV